MPNTNCVHDLIAKLRPHVSQYLMDELLSQFFDLSFKTKKVASEFEKYIELKAKNILRDFYPQTLRQQRVLGLSETEHEIDVTLYVPHRENPIGVIIECEIIDVLKFMKSLKSRGAIARACANKFLFLGRNMVVDTIFKAYDARIKQRLFYPALLKKAYVILVTTKMLSESAFKTALTYGIGFVQPMIEDYNIFIDRLMARTGLEFKFLDFELEKHTRYASPEEILEIMLSRFPDDPNISLLRYFCRKYLRDISDVPSQSEDYSYIWKRYFDFCRKLDTRMAMKRG